MMKRLFAALVLIAAAAMSVHAETPMSPIYPTGPRKTRPAVQPSRPAEPASVKNAAAPAAATGPTASGAASLEKWSETPAATAAIPPPAAAPAENTVAAATIMTDKLAAPVSRHPRRSYARRRHPAGYPRTYVGAYPGPAEWRGTYGPAASSAAGP